MRSRIQWMPRIQSLLEESETGKEGSIHRGGSFFGGMPSRFWGRLSKVRPLQLSESVFEDYFQVQQGLNCCSKLSLSLPLLVAALEWEGKQKSTSLAKKKEKKLRNQTPKPKKPSPKKRLRNKKHLRRISVSLMNCRN